MNKYYKNILKIIVSIVLIIIIIFSILYIKKYIDDGKENIEISNIISDEPVIEENITDTKTEKMLQLEELQKENNEIIGWLEIEGTGINYPVLQTTDNDYYLNHNYKKEYSTGGSIFLDKNFDLEKPSTNYLIYGHRMQNGTMFEELYNYRNEEYYKEHPVIKFTTNKEDVEYEIIAAFYSRVYYTNETNVFRYYYFIDANNETEFNDFVNNAKKDSIYDTGISANYGDQLLTLSTCSYHTEDGRFAVVARKKTDEK